MKRNILSILGMTICILSLNLVFVSCDNGSGAGAGGGGGPIVNTGSYSYAKFSISSSLFASYLGSYGTAPNVDDINNLTFTDKNEAMIKILAAKNAADSAGITSPTNDSNDSATATDIQNLLNPAPEPLRTQLVDQLNTGGYIAVVQYGSVNSGITFYDVTAIVKN